jgi:hypothetical protein
MMFASGWWSLRTWGRVQSSVSIQAISVRTFTSDPSGARISTSVPVAGDSSSCVAFSASI